LRPLIDALIGVGRSRSHDSVTQLSGAALPGRSAPVPVGLADELSVAGACAVTVDRDR
jgi:hypothetical protein